MIKIAHEAPEEIMPRVSKLTDYSYALVHLFETHPDYYDFFKSQLSLGREVILDNSIFELGEAFDSDKFAKWIEKLQPTEYIIPDALEDTGLTVDNAEKWMREYKDLPGKKIGVVQGTSYAELRYCYKNLLKLGVDKIAISFDYSYYCQRVSRNTCTLEERINKSTELMLWATGRIELLQEFLATDLIDRSIPHHLLGCSLIQEFRHYNGSSWKWIESMDTSNPVVLGLQNRTYDVFDGLSGKPSIKLFELINSKVDPSQLQTIEDNILTARQVIRGDRR